MLTCSLKLANVTDRCFPAWEVAAGTYQGTAAPGAPSGPRPSLLGDRAWTPEYSQESLLSPSLHPTLKSECLTENESHHNMLLIRNPADL